MILLQSLLGLLLLAPPVHDFHVSKTNVRYVAEREQVQVEMHVFLDDLELALTEAGAPKLYIGTQQEMPQTADHLARYLEKHFVIEWNGATLPVGLLGFEMSEDLEALWIYLAADHPEPPTKVSIQQTVITEVFADQRNMVKLFSGEQSSTLLTSRDQPRADYTFE